MAINISTLKVELLTGSHASLYSANVLLGNHGGIADTINAVSSPADTLQVGLASAMALQQCVSANEYLALPQAQRDLWNALLTTTAAAGNIPISNTLIRGQIAAVWSAATVTRGLLSNLQVRNATRAESLFGEGVTVDTNAIYVALTQ